MACKQELIKWITVGSGLTEAEGSSLGLSETGFPSCTAPNPCDVGGVRGELSVYWSWAVRGKRQQLRQRSDNEPWTLQLQLLQRTQKLDPFLLFLAQESVSESDSYERTRHVVLVLTLRLLRPLGGFTRDENNGYMKHSAEQPGLTEPTPTTPL